MDPSLNTNINSFLADINIQPNGGLQGLHAVKTEPGLEGQPQTIGIQGREITILNGKAKDPESLYAKIQKKNTEIQEVANLLKSEVTLTPENIKSRITHITDHKRQQKIVNLYQGIIAKIDEYKLPSNTSNNLKHELSDALIDIKRNNIKLVRQDPDLSKVDAENKDRLTKNRTSFRLEENLKTKPRSNSISTHKGITLNDLKTKYTVLKESEKMLRGKGSTFATQKQIMEDKLALTSTQLTALSSKKNKKPADLEQEKLLSGTLQQMKTALNAIEENIKNNHADITTVDTQISACLVDMQKMQFASEGVTNTLGSEVNKLSPPSSEPATRGRSSSIANPNGQPVDFFKNSIKILSDLNSKSGKDSASQEAHWEKLETQLGMLFSRADLPKKIASDPVNVHGPLLEIFTNLSTDSFFKDKLTKFMNNQLQNIADAKLNKDDFEERIRALLSICCKTSGETHKTVLFLNLNSIPGANLDKLKP